MSHYAAHVITWMKTQHIFRLLKRDFIIANVLDMTDCQTNIYPEFLFDLRLNEISDFTNRVIARGDVEDARDGLVSFNRARVCADSVFDTKDWTPDRWIVNRNCAMAQRGREHGVHNQIETHSGAISGNRSLTESDH